MNIVVKVKKIAEVIIHREYTLLAFASLFPKAYIL